MELQQYVKLLVKWWRLIVLFIVVSAGGTYLVSQRMDPVYAATTTFLIRPAPPTSSAAGSGALFTSDNLPQTVAQLMGNQRVLQEVIADLKLNTGTDALGKQIDVNIVRGTQLMAVTVEDRDPQRAADIANDVVRVYNGQNRALQQSSYQTTQKNLEQALAAALADVLSAQTSLDALGAPSTPEQIQEQVRLQLVLAQSRSVYEGLLQDYQKAQSAASGTDDLLTVVESAQPPARATRPNPPLYASLAAIVAALLSVAGVVLVGFLDDSVRSSEDVERVMGVPALARLAQKAHADPVARVVAASSSGSLEAEAYRMLAVTLGFAAADRPVRSLVVTGSGALEDRGAMAANLAVALAETGKRVILVDANLRDPSLHQIFRRQNQCGLTSVLQHPRPGQITDCLVSTYVKHLELLPSGPPAANPVPLLASQSFAQLLADLTAQADIVVLDGPPLPGAADSSILAHLCDATLLVVAASATRPAALARAKDLLAQAGAYLLGVVLTEGVVGPGRTLAQPARARPWFAPFRLAARSRANLPQSDIPVLNAGSNGEHDPGLAAGREASPADERL